MTRTCIICDKKPGTVELEEDVFACDDCCEDEYWADRYAVYL